MAVELGTAYISIIPSTKGLGKSLAKEFQGVEASAASTGQSAGSKLASGMGKALKTGAIATGAAVAGLLGTALVKGFGRLSAIENAEAKLKGLGNSAGDVTQIMDDALAAVKGTAFGMDEAATTAASAVAAGIKPGKELTKYLGLVGDAATIGGTSMAEMGSIFNKVATSGKVQGDIFAQLGDKGIPIVTLLAERLGVTAEAVYDMGSKGEISSADFLDAMSSMEGAALSSGNTTTGAFKNMWAAVSRFGASLLKDIYPLIGPLFGGITAWVDKATEAVGPLAEAFSVKLAVALKGLVSFGSSLGPMFSTLGSVLGATVVPALSALAGWIQRNHQWLVPLVAVVGSGVLAFQAYLGVIKLVTLAKTLMLAKIAAVRVAMLAMNAVMIANPIGLLIAALVALGVGLVLAYKHSETFRNIVNGAWNAVKAAASVLVNWFTGTFVPVFTGAIRGVVSFFTGTVVPNFRAATNAIGGFFNFLYRNFIGPFVFAFRLAIGAVSTWFRNTIVPAFRNAINVLGGLFRAFKTNVIDPVWNAIRARINIVMTWFRNTLVPIFRSAIQALQSRFETFRRGVATVWEGVKSAGTSAWNVVRTRVFDPMKAGLDKLKAGFEATQRGISTAWGKLRDAVRKPISFVVTKVINPFLTGYNKINSAWSGDDIGLIPGFRKGGYTGRKGRDEVAGVVHGDEHVIRSESRKTIEKASPGLLDKLNKHGASALPTFGHEGHAAHGGMAAGGPGGPGTYLWGGLQNSIYSSGVAHVRGSAPGFNIPAAARAWNNMSNLKVKYGSGPNQIEVGGGAPAGTWGYAWSNGQIRLNPGIPAGMKTGTAAHEIGHVLGLDHAGTNSIMHPMMQGPLWPSAYDRATIQRIYGGSGKGNPPEGGGGGGFDILGAIKKILSGPLEKLKSMMDGNLFSKMAGGIAKNVVNGVLEKASGGRIDDIWDAPVGTTHKLPKGASTIYNGTGGNEFFQRVDPSKSGGGLNIHGNVYTVDENEFANRVFKKAAQREALYAA